MKKVLVFITCLALSIPVLAVISFLYIILKPIMFLGFLLISAIVAMGLYEILKPKENDEF